MTHRHAALQVPNKEHRLVLRVRTIERSLGVIKPLNTVAQPVWISRKNPRLVCDCYSFRYARAPPIGASFDLKIHPVRSYRSVDESIRESGNQSQIIQGLVRVWNSWKESCFTAKRKMSDCYPLHNKIFCAECSCVGNILRTTAFDFEPEILFPAEPTTLGCGP